MCLLGWPLRAKAPRQSEDYEASTGSPGKLRVRSLLGPTGLLQGSPRNASRSAARGSRGSGGQTKVVPTASNNSKKNLGITIVPPPKVPPPGFKRLIRTR